MWYPSERWVRFYIHNRNLYSKGYGEYAVVKQLFSFQTVMVSWLFLKSIWPGLDNWIVGVGIPVMVVSRVCLGWSLGWWWDRYKIFDKENDWQNVRNPIQKAVSETLLDGRGL